MKGNIEALHLTFSDFLKAIELLAEKKFILPSLVLTYSTIDAAASLDRAPNQPDVEGKDFVAWVEKYLLPNSGIACSGLDLYGARCGLVHAFSAQSRKSREGKATEIAYAWGTSTVRSLQEVLYFDPPRKILAVHVDDLIRAVRVGYTSFLADVSKDPARTALVVSRAGNFFSHFPNILDQ